MMMIIIMMMMMICIYSRNERNIRVYITHIFVKALMQEVFSLTHPHHVITNTKNQRLLFSFAQNLLIFTNIFIQELLHAKSVNIFSLKRMFLTNFV